MKVAVRLDVESCRRWLLRFRDMVTKRGGIELYAIKEADEHGDGGLAGLLALEKMLVRRGRDCGSDPLSMNDLDWPSIDASDADWIIDLTTLAPFDHEKIDAPILRPRFNDGLGALAIAEAYFESGSPHITIEEFGTNHALAEGIASLEAATGVGGAIEAVYSRVAVLLLRILDDIRDDISLKSRETKPLAPAKKVKYIAKSVVSRIVREIYALACYPSHWRVGYRHNSGSDILAARSLKGEPWQIIPHPADHFYADPVPFHHQGRDYVFIEELDHKVGKGLISVVPFSDDGKPEPAQLIIEEDFHLSYPFLFEWQGDIWMIPETSVNHDVALYRCVDFPMKWERHQTLLSGLEIADVTLVEWQGRWWLFGVERPGWGGYSDTLAIFHAPTPLGPFEPHANNPVLIDHKTARPAGNMIVRDGALWRPVQDCANGYGTALGLAEVTTLTPETFDQKIHAVLYPGGPEWPGRKLHTWNKVGNLEVIDGAIYRPKSAALAKFVDRFYVPT